MVRKNRLDAVIEVLDNFLKTNFGGLSGSGRNNPAGNCNVERDSKEDRKKKKLAGELMRINHSGEVAAQGLYQGQRFLETDPHMRKYLEEAAIEEADHLKWTFEYMKSKDTKGSLLNPAWYFGSFTLALLVQSQGREKSKHFLAETERQVQKHLMRHLKTFPAEDEAAQKILKKMYEDEGEHASWAENSSSKNLTEGLSKVEKSAMKIMSKVMIELSKRI